MIIIDIPIPRNCEECPCSYWIRSGENEGKMMCNAIEFKCARNRKRNKKPADCIIHGPKTPDGCPIIR